MISVIKDICIFMIIAQAILFFVPGDVYMKYVRILVGIIMILRMTEPLFAFVIDEEEQRQMMEHIAVLEEDISQNQYKLEIEDNSMGIYGSIEDEIKNRLCQCDSGQYTVTEVELLAGEPVAGQVTDRTEAVEGICVTVESREKGQSKKERIEVKNIRIGGNEEQSGSTVDSTLSKTTVSAQKQELKSLYGACIGIDAERIEIIIK